MSRVEIVRYAGLTRMNHWTVVIFFFCAGLTGLALFHPYFFPLTSLFGGGSWSRILHPFFGVLMFVFFLGMFVKLWHENLWTRLDTQWIRNVDKIALGDEHSMPEQGRNNAGQKGVFWVASICLIMLLVTGVMFWRPYFADAFPIPVIRIAALLHAAAATGLILIIVAHIYAAIWVKGSIRAMTRGTVTPEWARQHHPIWYREVANDAQPLDAPTKHG